MPGPAVYILAVFAAVGTAIIVKEFVYDPHIAPLIQEYRDNRRRRRNGPVSVRQSHSSDTSDDESSVPLRGFGEKGHDDSGSEFEGQRQPQPPKKPRRGVDIELEDLVAREIREWSSSANTHGLRLRKNAANTDSNTLDEANQHLSFAPIAPSRPGNATNRALSPISSPPVAPIHLLTSLGQPSDATYDSVSARQHTTPSPTRTPFTRSPTLSTAVPTPSPPRALGLPFQGNSNAETALSPSVLFSYNDRQSEQAFPSPRASPPRFSPAEVAKDLPALPTFPPAANEPTSALTFANLRPLAIPIRRQLSTESGDGTVSSIASSATSAVTARPPLSPPFASRPPLPRLPSAHSDATLEDHSSPFTQATGISRDASPAGSPVPQPVPSLSQSYPQDLDYEQNVVLLSPPSSRSASPFSVLGSGESVESPNVGFRALTSETARPRSTSDTSSASSNGQRSTSNPFVDPATPRTPSSARIDLDSDMSDWEHASGLGGSPSPPRPRAPAANITSPGQVSSVGFGSDDDDDVFSDSGLSEASLSSWASVSGRSSNGA